MIDRELYRRPVPLDRTAHRRLRLARASGDPAAAAHANALFVTAAEFADASREYPLVFVRTTAAEPGGASEVGPIAVLGLERGENLYWDGARWDARYLPAYLRRHPFAMARLPEQQLAVLVDADWSGLSETEGEPIFDADGEPVAAFETMRRFLEQFEAESERTRIACARLVELELLQPMRFDATLLDGRTLAVDGFLTVDEAKVRALPDATIVELERRGLLAMIHLHLASLGLMRRLVERRMAREAAKGGAA